MALLPNDTPKRTRLRLLSIVPRGAMGAGNEPSKGSGGDEALIIRVPSTQSVPALRIQTQPVSGAPTDLAYTNQNGDTVQSGLPGVLFGIRQVTLTAAQIIGLSATPVSVLPAPGAGAVIYVDQITFQMKPGGTQFTGTGTVNLVYHGGSIVPHSSSIPAATVTSASASNNIFPPLTAVIQPPTNTGVDITASAAFAAGNGTAIVTIWYSIVTLS